MSSINIQCTRDTYVSRFSKSTDHTGELYLFTDYASSSSVIGETSYQTALLQFAIPKEIRYKQITKAVLHYYFGSDVSETEFKHVSYTPYLINNTTDIVTYTTVGTLGTLGERKTVNRTYSGGEWIAEDITDIFTNNLTDGNFSVFVGAGRYTPDDDSGVIISYIGGSSGSKGSYLTITYEDVEQLPPTLTYPIDVYVRQGEGVLFSWVYNSLTAATQKAVTLEWKASTETEYQVITLEQSAQSYFAEIEFPAGIIDWRLKVTNDVDEVSAYAEAKFVVIGKPAIPVITGAANRTLTEITWNASDQCVFEIAISDANGNVLLTETVHSGEMSYRPNLFLDNGTYNIKLRTKNSIELWSDYTNKTITIDAVAPVQPTFAMYASNSEATLVVNRAEGTKAVVLRSEKDGEYEPIAVMEADENEFTDRETKSGYWYRYKVRAYDAGYSDSESQTEIFNYDGFYLQTEKEKLNLTLSDEKFEHHTETPEPEMAVLQYSGRVEPVVEYGEHKIRRIQKRMFVNHEEKFIFDRICEAENKFYRDGRGNAFPCALAAVQYSRYMNQGYIVSFEVIEVGKEEVRVNV